MKNKIFSSVLISMAFPVCGNAVTVAGDELNIGTGNVVLAGSKSGAIGVDNAASDHSLTIGWENVADGGSLAGGRLSTMDEASASSLIFGEYIQSYGVTASAIFGVFNYVNPDSFGTGPSGGGDMGLLISGKENGIFRGHGQQGFGNTILGELNVIDPTVPGGDTFMNSSALIGSGNTTSKTLSWVIGQGNIGQTGAVTLGTYGSVVAESASLVVGTGSSDSLRANGLVVLKDGRVQIPGSLVIGESAEPALTTTTAVAAGYLKRISGTGATGGSSALLVLGSNASAPLSGLAIGNGAVASGAASFAIGTGSKAESIQSYAFGFNADSNAPRSMALGYMSISSGQFSTAIGYYAKSVGQYSIALGGEALGHSSLAFGGGKANADYSTASMGGVASGVGSIAISTIHAPSGGTATASGAAATAIGGGNPLASGDLSFTSGFQTTSSAAHSTAFGSRNLSRGTGLVPADTTSWVETEALFELGNGKPSLTPAQYSNAITTLKNGRTTLTNKFWVSTTPEVVPAATDASAGEALAVEGHAKVKGNATIDGTTILNGKVILAEAQGDISMGIYQ